MQINCDLGECLTPDPDAQIMPLIDMANIACGGHAGDENSMSKTIQLAKQHGAAIGAHPSYQDQANFGRLSLDISSSTLFDSLYQQLTRFIALCDRFDTAPQYVKPHGALYHDMMHRPEVLETICAVMQAVQPQFKKSPLKQTALKLVVQAGVHSARMQQAATTNNIQFLYEAFADRGYRQNTAEMIPRKEVGALLPSAAEILAQLAYFETQTSFKVDTICFHSDHAPSVQALMQKARS